MKYRNKLIEVEAVRWTDENLKEIETFCGKSLHDIIDIAKGRPYKLIVIKTLKDNIIALEGDYIIKDISSGEFYPCKSDTFKATYEEVKEVEDNDYCSDCKYEYKRLQEVEK